MNMHEKEFQLKEPKKRNVLLTLLDDKEIFTVKSFHFQL